MKDPDDIGWYYCIRRQKRSVNEAIKELNEKYECDSKEIKRFEHGSPVTLKIGIYESLSKYVIKFSSL